MNSDLTILIGGLVLLLLLGLGWMRHYLLQKMQALTTVESDLMALFEDRRDVLPFLLESYRAVEPKVKPVFKQIVTQRAEARNSKEFQMIWQKEQKLEELVGKLFVALDGHTTLEKDIGWLEAKHDIQKKGEQIHDQLDRRHVLNDYLQEKKRQFPYGLVGRFMR
jgi:hypothetical protein